MERRLLLALLLCFLLTYAYMAFYNRGAGTVRPRTSPTPPPPSPETRAAIEPAPAPEPEVEEEERTLRAGPFFFRFANRGGVAREVRLSGFVPTARSPAFNPEDPETWLVLARSPGRSGSFAVRDHGGSLGLDLEGVLWESTVLDGGEGGGSGIVFARDLDEDLRLEKRITVPEDSFAVRISLALSNKNAGRTGRDLVLAFLPAVAVVSEEDPYYAGPVAAAANAGRRGLELEKHVRDLAGKERFRPFPPGQIRFAGTYNKYFLGLVRPLPGTLPDFAQAEAILDQELVDRRRAAAPSLPPDDPALRKEAWRYVAGSVGLRFHVPAPDRVETKNLEVFFGPKDLEVLRGPYEDFRAVVEDDYGWFGSVSAALGAILRFYHRLTGSWGVAILLLTLTVRGAVHPLSRRNAKKMAAFQRKIQKIQPEVEAIRRRYKDQFGKMQQELGKVYREHGIRPVPPGCLTMLLQMPVWIGLFQYLRVAFELRQAPFLWIPDLSRPDETLAFGGAIPLLGTHLNVLPIAMVAMWVIQQKTAPKPTDPQQAQMAKIMVFMPVIFGFMLYNYAAGLSLYMTASSLLGYFEQKMLRRAYPPPAPLAPAKR